ncbi:acyl-CoA thioester hydrolase [Luteibacter sp. Sphag1AF]|uniref:tol-pal system-associated acyl-CoA thioesterase n=1 Tax=Luteibacter sp. Sphag1AF TaxID=2587031 RepID=UPI00160DF5DF|nr:tol-pal system-associated acyl-CoA thioesterase [Luteibacter sp. Sphag1AF]MBB3227563.1 acyl-CoA thioester hydrolase [Luteibacter sp. Sphag1AF]
MSLFTWPVRIYWEDTDAGGLVYHANYVRFLERGRTEWMRAQGIDQVELRERTGLGFVVREMNLDFLRPARLDDELLVSVAVKERRSASMLFHQDIARRDGSPLLKATVRVACVDLAAVRPAQIPGDLFFQEFLTP